ncbi:substrate-binding periplasmic protein [Thaumasiovibrio subtropicus]|uniref:substrate-binding periplasmic protein n=1 Tax=Thaumasiovibrio subtropicus TaxID=1891207 RepID=UPI000B359BF6|nr:transporter substrate-binding domain-containing protein [Thaumasiovibrio subtropicus]
MPIHALCIITLLTVFVSHTHAQQLKVAFGADKPPFVYEENGETKGIEIDIVSEALAYSGYSIETITTMPYNRLTVGIANGYADIVAGVQISSDNYYFSEPYVGFENYAITKESQNTAISAIPELKQYSVATWKNAHQHLGRLFEEIYSPKSDVEHKAYTEFVDQQAQVDFFLLNRADVLLIDISIFYWFRKQFIDNPELSDRTRDAVLNQGYVFHEIFPKTTQFYVNFADIKLRDDFNRGLRHLKESGRYKAIYDSYHQ